MPASNPSLPPLSAQSGLVARALQVGDRGPVELAIPGADCASLAGASGSGKTLLLRALADLDPHRGAVALNGRWAHQMPAAAWRRRVGMLPADNPWWFERVGQHFADPVPETLNALGFDRDVLAWKVTRLSSGERQRLALARLLAVGPQALLLDEASANLDPDNTLRVERLIEDYRRQRHAPVLWVSHDPEQRHRVASRHWLIDDTGLTEEPS